MDFTCSSDALAQAVSMAQKAAATKSPVTQLEGMRISAIGGSAVFYCTDREIGVECTMKAEINVEGETVVNARLISEIVRSLPGKNARIRMVNDVKIQVTSDDAAFELFVIQTDAFPPFPSIDLVNEYRIDQLTFKRMLQQTAFAVGVDDTRKNLTGLFLEGDGRELRAVAVDGFRIALRRQEVKEWNDGGAGSGAEGGAAGSSAGSGSGSGAGSGSGDGAAVGGAAGGGAGGVTGDEAGDASGSGTGGVTGNASGNASGSGAKGDGRAARKRASAKISMIIPAKSISELVKIIPSEKGALCLYGNRKQAVATFAGCRMYTRVIDGEFFNYRYILPKDYVTQMTIPKSKLQEAVERASVILDVESMRRYPVMLKASGATLDIRALSDLGNVHDIIRVDVEGEDIEAAFNPKFLIEALRAIEDEVIIVRFTTRVGQILFMPVGHDGFAYLTLPVRVETR